MSAWWTEWSAYTLADLLIAVALGLAILVCALRPGAAGARAAAGMLAACWLWVGWAFLARRYAPINWAADYFALGFSIEALLLFWTGTVRGRLALRALPSVVGRAGLGIWGFALLAYPLLAPVSGRPWLQMEMFGLAPDPTAVATLGLLLCTSRVPWRLLALPLLWCAISGATLFTMGAADAWVAPAAALLALLLTIWKALLVRHAILPGQGANRT